MLTRVVTSSSPTKKYPKLFLSELKASDHTPTSYFSRLPKSTYQSPASVASAIDEMADVIMASATQKAKDAIEEAGQHKVRHWNSK